MNKKQEAKKSNEGKNTLRRVLLIVLGIILLAAAVIGYQLEKEKNSPAGIYASHYEVAPNIYHPVTRGNSDSLTQAFMAYENGNYPEAVEKFSELIKVDRSIELKFYQAMAYAEIENYPLALKNLENIKRFQSDYLDDSYWYLGLFYLKTGKQPSAIRHFQDFIELTEDSEKKAGAIAILTILLDL